MQPNPKCDALAIGLESRSFGNRLSGHVSIIAMSGITVFIVLFFVACPMDCNCQCGSNEGCLDYVQSNEMLVCEKDNSRQRFCGPCFCERKVQTCQTDEECPEAYFCRETEGVCGTQPCSVGSPCPTGTECLHFGGGRCGRTAE